MLLPVALVAQVNYINGIVNQYTRVNAIAGNIITVNNTIFQIGDGALLIQMDAPNSNALSGNFEFGRVTAVNNLAMTVTLDSINQTYDVVNSNVQLVKVACTGNAIVNGVLTCAAYNAVTGTGGVLAISTCDPAFNPTQSNLILQANIDVSGKGFAGAINNTFAANGNGADPANQGGNNFGGPAGTPGGGYGAGGGGGGGAGGIGGGGGGMLSGGGGGVAAPGGGSAANGGNAAGTGTFNKTNKVFMGAGGGYEVHKNGGSAGTGGGIIFIFTDTLFGNGNLILADGAASANQACGGGNYPMFDHFGGGGGGQIIVRNTGGYVGNLTIAARGGNSNSCLETGGGGGGGGIWSDNVFPINVVTIVNGGISINAALNTQNGGIGLVIANPANPLYLDGDTSASIQGLFCKATVLLPVELLDFSGVCIQKDAVLKWKTGSEVNNDHFIIHRSLDGKTFAYAGKKAGSGNSSGILAYTFEDSNVFEKDQKVFYRLEQVDFNGFSTQSPVIVVRKNETNQEIQLSINKLTGEATMKVQSFGSDEVIIIVSDIPGRIVKSFPVTCSDGINTISFRIHELAPGSYMVRIEGKSGIRIKKFIVE